MSDLRPVGTAVNLDGKEWHLLFTLNAIDEIQTEFNVPLQEAVKQVLDVESGYEPIKKMLRILLNDELERTGTEPNITDKKVGWMLTNENLATVMVALMEAYGLSMPEGDDDEEEDPNLTAGQG